MRVELVGPNSDGMVDIHAEGCRDVPRGERGRWTLEGATVDEIARAETLANYSGEVEPDQWESWLSVKPCARTAERTQ